MMEFVSTPKAPAPGGHYSQAVIANGFVFVSGQLAQGPGNDDIPADVRAQAKQVLANIEQILLAAGSGLEQIVNISVFITDIAHWPIVNDVFIQVFGSHKPARIIAVSPELHFGQVEMQAVALVARST